MPSRKSGLIVIGLGALLAVPLSWSPGAEAKSVSCEVTQGSQGFITLSGRTYSLECSGEGMTVRGQARAKSDQTGVQVNLITASGTTSSASATAFGYGSNQQFIPSCSISDFSAGGSFINKNCNASVFAVVISASGTAP